MDGVPSHWEVGGSKNGFVRLVVYIEIIQVVWYLTAECWWNSRAPIGRTHE